MKFIKKILSCVLAVTMAAGCVGIVPVQVNAEENVEITAEWLSQNRSGLEELEITLDPSIVVGEENEISISRAGAEETKYWLQFGSDYYYNQLGTDAKAFWDELETNCAAVAAGTDDVTKISATYENTTEDEFIKTVWLFYFSHPQFYFLKNNMGYNYSGTRFTVNMRIYDEFCNGEARQTATGTFTSRINAWLDEINQGKYDEDKEYIAHKIVCSNTIYNAGDYNQSAYSMVVLGETVCAGYAATMQILLNGAGIDAFTVISSNHAWNVVKLHDIWYNLDATWDDQERYGCIYMYYNKSDISFTDSSHTPEDTYDDMNLPDKGYDSNVSDWTYKSAYFNDSNYVYFTANKNSSIGELCVKAVDSVNGAVLGLAPQTVAYDNNDYSVLNGCTVDLSSVKSFVSRLYILVLGRTYDEGGLNSWTTALALGNSSGVDAGWGFVFSDECKNRMLSNEEFVEILYNTFMDRASDEGGKTAWVSQLDAGVDREKVFEGFVLSAEFAEICGTYGINAGSVDDVGGLSEAVKRYRNQNANLTKFIARCYTKALGRDYETDGLEAWCRAVILKNNTPKEVAQNFIFSDEFVLKNLSNEDYVKVLYRTFMGREADESGLGAWVLVLESGREDRRKVLEGFSDSAEFSEILESFGLN